MGTHRSGRARRVAVAALLVAFACSKQQEAPPPVTGERVDLGALSFVAPASWSSEKPANQMRLAQFAIGEASDGASMVVFHFGRGGGGGVEQNVQRWIGQFVEQPDAPNIERAKIVEREIAGLKVTTVDLSGAFVGMQRPGAAPSAEKPDHRLLGAIVSTDAGPYFFKLVGPIAVVAKAEPEYEALLSSLVAKSQ